MIEGQEVVPTLLPNTKPYRNADINIFSSNDEPHSEQLLPINTISSLDSNKKALPRWLITVEPILFIVVFTQTFTGSIAVNLLETVACLVDLGLDYANCTQPLSPQVELLVQPKTAFLSSCLTVVQAVIPSVLSLFIGPWSDQNGRKPFLIISLTGFTLSHASWGVLSCMKGLHLTYFILPALLVALTGGMVTVTTCTDCYISDISTDRNRAFRLAIISSVSLLGTVSGFLMASKMFDIYPSYGYQLIFFSSSFACFLSLVYTIFLVNEVITKQKDWDKNLFNFAFVQQILACICEKHQGYSKPVTFTLLSVCFFMSCLIYGESSVKYLTLKRVYSWTFEDFNFFSAITNFVCVILSSAGIYILKKLRWSDLWICVLGSSVWCLSDVLLSFASSQNMFWIYSLVGSFAALTGPALTAELTMSVPKNNLGKLLALKAIVDSLAQFSAPPMFAAIYATIYVDHPLLIYLVSAGFAVFMTILIGLVLILKLKTSNLLDKDDHINHKADED